MKTAADAAAFFLRSTVTAAWTAPVDYSSFAPAGGTTTASTAGTAPTAEEAPSAAAPSAAAGLARPLATRTPLDSIQAANASAVIRSPFWFMSKRHGVLSNSVRGLYAAGSAAAAAGVVDAVAPGSMETAGRLPGDATGAMLASAPQLSTCRRNST